MAAAPPVVVCGGGIVGASIAYYLSLKGMPVTLVEGTRVAAAASGKAGGFLGRDWGDGSPTQQLHRVSFALHAELAEELGVESYRKLPTMQVRAGGGAAGAAQGKVPWLDGRVASAGLMDPATAQVTPAELTEKLVAAAVANGATLLTGRVEGVVLADDEADSAEAGATVTGVRVDGATVLCSRAVFALGPWSVLLEDWLPGQSIPMVGVKSRTLIPCSR